MKHLRRQFAAFVLILAIGFVVLVVGFHRQIEREERSLALGYAEQIFERVQEQTSALLATEDERPFGEFRFLEAVAGGRSGEVSMVRSPLSRLPENDPRGFLGHFQIDPDGAFSTPYLHPGLDGAAGFPPVERKARADREETLARLTASLQDRVRAGWTRKEVDRGTIDAIELSTSSKEMVVEGTDRSDENAKLREREQDSERLRLDLTPKGSSRESAPTEAELRAFESFRRAIQWGDTRTSKTPVPARPVSIDPFQARLVDKRYVVFYRKLWVDQMLYLQGFVLDAVRFHDWLTTRALAGSPLAGHAEATLSLGAEEIARSGPPPVKPGASSPLFERAFGYPLNRFVWRARASSYPRLPARNLLAVFASLAGAVIALGLVSIYRTAAAEVRLSRKRQDLVSAVTHELRTPLTSIRMYAEMLEEGMAENEAKRLEYYRHISKESARLSRLIENVLQLARLERKTYRVEPQVRVPAADFDEIGRELSALLERQGFRFVRNVPPDPLPAVSYDPDAVRQVLLAFLDNSVKFAAEAPDRTIEMSLTAEGETVVWAWSDRGPGVPEGELGRIFETFYRVEGETTRRTKGTGIGLAVARMLAEAMGARIDARNRAAADGGGLEVRLAFRAANVMNA